MGDYEYLENRIRDLEDEVNTIKETMSELNANVKEIRDVLTSKEFLTAIGSTLGSGQGKNKLRELKDGKTAGERG